MEKFIKIPKGMFTLDERTDSIPAADFPKLTHLFIWISRYLSPIERCSWITIEDLFQKYNQRPSKDKPKAYYDILSTLKYMHKVGYFEIYNNVKLSEEPSYKIGIKLLTSSDFFLPKKNYLEIYLPELNALDEISSYNKMDKDMTVTTYCYLRFLINNMNKRVLYRNPTSIAADLGYKTKQIEELLRLFVTPTESFLPLLAMDVNRQNGICAYSENKEFRRKTDKDPVKRKF